MIIPRHKLGSFILKLVCFRCEWYTASDHSGPGVQGSGECGNTDSGHEAVGETRAVDDTCSVTHTAMEMEADTPQHSKKKLHKLSKEWKMRRNKRRKKRLEHRRSDKW